MDLLIKREVEEPAENFILSTNENERVTGPYNRGHSKNRITVSNGFIINTDIKQEPINNDVDNSEFGEEYLDEDSETEYTQETSRAHNSEPRGGKKGRERTTPTQIQKLADFMNNKDKYSDSDDAMRILTDQLNMIGPPIRTSVQWRRTWSIIKYNNKRRRQNVLDVSERSKRMRLDVDADATNSTSSKTHDTNDEDTLHTKDHFHSQILKKMTLVLQQQTEQTNQLEKLNKNLEKLIDVLTEKVT